VSAGLRLVPGHADHVPMLAPRLRAIDRLECRAMGHSAEQALALGLCTGARTWTALVDGQPHAMFGVVAEEGDTAIPWFLGSAQVGRHARALIAQGPAIVAAMHRHGRCLCNFVSSGNGRAIRLLEHWGFTVEDQSVVVRGVAFRRFIRETQSCAPPPFP
jgi:hypothetical protein